MTLREKMEDILIQRGMFSKDATAIMDMVTEGFKWANPLWWSMLNKNLKNCPATCYKPIWNWVKMSAKDWLEENVPGAWYLPKFSFL